MKTKLLSLLMVLSLTSLQAQEISFFTTTGSNRLTEEQLDQHADKLKGNMEKAMNKTLYITFEVYKEEIKSDTLLQWVKLAVSDKDPAKNPFTKLLNQPIAGAPYPTNGKPTLVNFWFTKCAPCIDEMPVLNRIKKDYQDRFNFVAITYETQEAVDQFMQTHDFDFDQYADQQTLIDQIGIQAYPKNIILDAEGRVQKVMSGIAYIQDENKNLIIGDGQELIKALEASLKE
ncbi:MAG: TlpA family protein disulfide reductase [Flavobacteriaceae bacterium]|nr:TlpA family protein disulfide reductase [Flavobacteriaceae bacterium]